MEPEHETYVRKQWPAQAPKMRVLGIPDVFEPDDPELRDRLTKVVRGLLAEASGDARSPAGCPAPGRPAGARGQAGPALRPGDGRCRGIGCGADGGDQFVEIERLDQVVEDPAARAACSTS